MTYCAGILVQDGLVMIADTRTNAGVDDVSVFRKLHVFETPGERIFAVATSGNLSVTQSALSLLAEGIIAPGADEPETLDTATSMFRAAHLVGQALRTVKQDIGPALERDQISAEASILFGGQIRGGPLKLYMIYSTGNFIECGADSPFLQIGEHKYGRPILVRSVTFKTEIYDALKLGLISMDSTLKSNLAVGLPIDLLVLRRDKLKSELIHRIEPEEAYFHDLSEQWSDALRAAHTNIPRPPYGA